MNGPDEVIELVDKDKRYSKLLDKWNILKSKLKDPPYANEHKLSHYTVPEDHDPNELPFEVFGMKLFMRFRHDFEHGTVEYGITKVDDKSGTQLRVPVVSVHFSRTGALHEPYQDYIVEDYNKVHWQVLASNMDAFRKAAFESEVGE